MTRSDSVARIRARLRHPIVDTDGHTIEYLPALRDELATLAGAAAVAQLDRVLGFAHRAQPRSRRAPARGAAASLEARRFRPE